VFPFHWSVSNRKAVVVEPNELVVGLVNLQVLRFVVVEHCHNSRLQFFELGFFQIECVDLELFLMASLASDFDFLFR